MSLNPLARNTSNKSHYPYAVAMKDKSLNPLARNTSNKYYKIQSSEKVQTV